MLSKNLIGSSDALLTVLEEIAMVAPIDCAVLIQGETGTGKELVARAIHENGPRCNKPFIAVNCAAIPHELLESELFGHEKGAFTGAIQQTIGKFRAAHGGTLFLDEIGDMPLKLQPKLLRVLQERKVERVGGSHAMSIDVRIIAATNVHLQEMVNNKLFRADLYFRLNVFPMKLPPLRDRKGDIPILVNHFVRHFGEKLGRTVACIPIDVLDRLHRYHWPGNIRELQNWVERAMIMSSGDTLTLRPNEFNSLILLPRKDSSLTLFEMEKAHISEALEAANWIIGGPSGAAVRLGVPRTTLISRMKKLGISGKRVTSPTVQKPLSEALMEKPLYCIN